MPFWQDCCNISYVSKQRTMDIPVEGRCARMCPFEIKAIYRWRCMPTATPRIAGSTKDASFNGCGGELR